MTLQERYIALLESTNMSLSDIHSYTSDFDESQKDFFYSSTGFKIDRKWKNRHQPLEEQLGLLLKAASENPQEYGIDHAPILIRAFPISSINAKVIRYPEGYLILIHDGIFLFFNLFLSIVLRSKRFQSLIFQAPMGKFHLEEEDEIKLLSSLFYEYLFHGMEGVEKNEELMRNVIVAEDDSLFSVFMNLENEISSFIQAHEMSHILKGHFFLGKEKKIVTIEKDILYVNTNEFTQEWEADMGASYILFNGSRKRTVEGKTLRESDFTFLFPHILSGIYIFCYVSHFIDVIIAQSKKKFDIKIPIIWDHPLGLDRLNLINQYLVEKGVFKDLTCNIGIASAFTQHFYNMDYRIWMNFETKLK